MFDMCRVGSRRGTAPHCSAQPSYGHPRDGAWKLPSSTIQPMPDHAYLTFGIDANRYAISATSVVEIVRAVAVMPLPGAPPIVTGLIDYRGAILPVFDVARRFRHASRAVRAAHRLIIATAGARTVALHVDAVDRLIDLIPETIEVTPSAIDPAVPIAGLARTHDGMLVIQDLDRFLSTAEASQLDDALARTS